MGKRVDDMTSEGDERSIQRNIDFNRLYEELMEELDQARRERAELINLIKALRLNFENEPRTATVQPATKSVTESNGLRIGLFVDVQNIFYNARNFYGRKLDFKKLIDIAGQGRDLVTAVAYLVFSPDVDQTNFITMLQQNGYTVREKMPYRADDAPAPTDSPIPMHTDVRENLGNLDLAVLVGADGDTLPLVRDIHAAGPKVELYGFAQNTDEDLVQEVDEFRVIDENLLLNQEYGSRQQHSGSYRGTRTNSVGGQHGNRGNARAGYLQRPGSRNADTRGT